jgi:hypothetical protein
MLCPFILTSPLRDCNLLCSLPPSIAPPRRAASVMALNVKENVLVTDFIAVLQVLMVFGLIAHAALDEDDIEIPQDVIRDMVLEVVDEHDLPPLTGKRTRASSASAGQPKRPHIKYDYQRAEQQSVFSDWVGEVSRFPDKQFERTFRIKRHIVDTILNHLCRRSSFWVKR